MPLDAWRLNYRADKSERTAISRRSLSSPARWLRENNLVLHPCLDYGCGRGGDADRLGCACYDPALRGQAENLEALQGRYATILVHYVLNTVPSASTRAKILADVRELLLPGGRAYVAVRTDRRALRGRTRRGTWQGKITLPGPTVAKGSGWEMWEIKKMAKKRTKNMAFKSSVRERLPNRAFAAYKYIKKRKLPVYRYKFGKLKISISHVNNALSRLNQTHGLTGAQRRKVKADLHRLQRKYYKQQGETCPPTTSGCPERNPATGRFVRRRAEGRPWDIYEEVITTDSRGKERMGYVVAYDSPTTVLVKVFGQPQQQTFPFRWVRSAEAQVKNPMRFSTTVLPSPGISLAWNPSPNPRYAVLTPAYGRDYRSKKAVTEAFDADKDFLMHGFGHGRPLPINRTQLRRDTDFTHVQIRYAALRSVVVIELAKPKPRKRTKRRKR